MAVWFRKPNVEQVQEQGYLFWVRESQGIFFDNFRNWKTNPDFWDMRYYIQIPIIPLAYVLTFFNTYSLKRDRVKKINLNAGLTLYNKHNIKLFRGGK